jgi:hypothetical protein
MAEKNTKKIKLFASKKKSARSGLTANGKMVSRIRGVIVIP